MLNPTEYSSSDGSTKTTSSIRSGGNDAENLVNQIAVRIEHGHAFTVFNVLPDEIEKQRGFAGAACADDVGMPHALFGGQPDFNRFAGMVVVAKQQTLLPDNGRCRLGLGRLPLKNGRADGTGRQMDKADQLVAVEQHPRAPGLAAQHVLNVFLERVIVVMKRDEFVAVRDARTRAVIRQGRGPVAPGGQIHRREARCGQRRHTAGGRLCFPLRPPVPGN